VEFAALKSYTVTFDPNGGAGAAPTETDKAAGETFKAPLPAGITAPSGKQFKEWNTLANGNGIAAYLPGATVTMPDNNLTLYAIWEPIPAPVIVTGVAVTPNPAEAQKGATKQFNATVYGTNNPAQTVTWSVNSNTAGTSISTGGLLTVAANETAATLTVTAASTVDATKSGTSTVAVIQPPPPDVTKPAVTPPPAWDCGTTPGALTAALGSNGTLTISGSGYMADFTAGNVPWSSMSGSITSAVVGNDVTSIGARAFYGCGNLRSIAVSDAITAIGDSAFFGCGNLATMTSLAAIPPKAAANAFTWVQKVSCGIYVPRNSLAAYRKADVWKEFRLLDILWDLPDEFASSEPSGSGQAAVVVPDVGADGNRPALAVGPNPVSKSIGSVGIFYQGKPISSGTLTIYDAAGNVIRKIRIADVGANKYSPHHSPKSRRLAGTWDLQDSNGRQVPDGTYLIRGAVKTADGRRESVSMMVGVR
jgi:hypothetical protein